MSNILITGGSGSLGNAIIKQLKNDNILSISRNETFIARSRILFPDVNFVIGDIKDKNSIKKYFKNIDYVIHCAAIKHVSNAELYKDEAIKTNIYGTQNILSLCEENNIKKILFVSSDKAASPENFYGLTKLLAEQIVLDSSIHSNVIRFGNIIKSNGSIFDLWSNAKDVINVTDINMTRFFIEQSECAKLIEHVLYSDFDKKIIIPKMKSVKIYDVALEYAKQKNLNINIVKNQFNEKVNELLMSPEEHLRSEDFDTYWVLHKIDKFFKNKNYNIFNLDSNNLNQWNISKLIDMIQ